MKSTLKNFIFSTLLILTALSASAQKNINQYEPQFTFERGLLLFENRHYASALECFENYLLMVDDSSDANIVMAKYYEAVSSLFLGNSKGETKILNFVKENPTHLMAEHANFLYANTLFANKKISRCYKDLQ